MPAPACDLDCTCRKHSPVRNLGGRPCSPDCTCRRHVRTPEHNARIGMSVALTREAQRGR